MGRRETPVDPAAGPVQRFAHELRGLRREAGGPTYREMARRAHYSVTSLSQAAAGEVLPSLAVTLAYVGACGGDLAEWEGRWHRTREEAAVRIREDDEAAPPYQGLARFEPGDRERFFGRGELTSVLCRAVAEHRFTALFGASGSGKSSLLRAGLIPALRQGWGADGGAGVRLAAIRVLTPGAHPMTAHADVLRPRTDRARRDAPEGGTGTGSGTGPETGSGAGTGSGPETGAGAGTGAGAVRRDPAGRGGGAGNGSGPGDTLVVVDQFEEVFTLCPDPAERAAFIDLLLAARRPDSGLRVVVAVRADFYGRCAEHRRLAEAMRDSSLPVGPMTREELREVVVRPAQAAGLIVERSLTARLVREVEGRPGGLPLLSHVLRETWLRRRGRALTEEAYRAAGGLEGAIAQSAEDVFAGLSPEQAVPARLVLLRLVAPGEGSQDTGRRAERAELEFAAADDVAVVVDRFVRARLLTLDDDTVCLAHEALLTAWPRLVAWIEEDRERLRAHRRLSEAARSWDDLGREPGTLYRGARLATAEELFGADPDRAAALTPLEGAFLADSLAGRARERRRRRVLTGLLSGLLALSLVAGLVAWQQSRVSERRRVAAEAGRLAAVATGLRLTDPAAAVRLSLAAWRLAPTLETRSALLGSLTQQERDVFTVPGAGRAETAHHLAEDGRTLTVIAADRVETWDVRSHRRTGTHPGIGTGPGGEDRTGWTVPAPDGRTLALLDGEDVRLWDVRTGRVTGRLPGASAMSGTFGGDGRTLLVDSMGESGDGFASSFQVWDVPRRRRLLDVPLGDTEAVQGSDVSADGRWLAVCTDKRPLEIRDLRRGGRKLPLPWLAAAGGGHCFAGGFAFSPDSRGIALVTGSGVRRWELPSGRELPALAGTKVQEMRFSADGRFLVASTLTDEILLWRLAAPGAPVFRHALVSESTFGLRLDLDEGVVRYGARGGATVRSVALGGAVSGQWRTTPVGGAAWSPDGRFLAAVGRAEGAGYEILDAAGRLLTRLPGAPCPDDPAEEEPPVEGDAGDATGAGEGTVELTAEEAEGAQAADTGCQDALAFSPDGRHLAYGAVRQDVDPDPGARTRQSVRVWDIRAGRLLHTVDLDRGSTPLKEGELPLGVVAVALGDDGRTLVVSRLGEREVLEAWDVPTGRRLRSVPGLSGSELALRRNGGVAVSEAGSVDLRSGRAVRRALGWDDPVALAFSPDGTRLAVGDTRGRVSLWDGDVRRHLGVLPGTHTGTRRTEDEEVAVLAFSPDGTTLAVAGDSGTVQLWDTASRRLLGSALPTPGDRVLSMAFGPDGRTLRVAGAHVPVHGYDLDPDRVAALLCARVGSGPSPAEWRAHLPTVPHRPSC
ncbi:DNA-binding protein [Streptomyces sp. DH12]|uniref:nSTAND1 domain-containing NTPase n=1 Tax=Streptomyces sp. DH12 TaxID=2857010 RepID=UPI001E2A108E|nr:DNA-binding protein [Streptomyces sp. DH12]